MDFYGMVVKENKNGAPQIRRPDWKVGALKITDDQRWVFLAAVWDEETNL